MSKYSRNKIDKRIVSLQYSANKSIEDRTVCYQLKNIEGIFAGIYDGHGGW